MVMRVVRVIKMTKMMMKNQRSNSSHYLSIHLSRRIKEKIVMLVKVNGQMKTVTLMVTRKLAKVERNLF